MLAGSIANDKLVNSSITIGTNSVSLGSSLTTIADLTLTKPTIDDFTNANHDHSNVANGGQIPIANTTGTLAVNRGGTGQTTYTNGQLLIGNNGSLTKATLSSSNPISITNGNGSISIGLNYNTTNLTLTSNALNTIQDIHSEATPQFSRIGLGGASLSNISLLATTTANTILRLQTTNTTSSNNLMLI